MPNIVVPKEFISKQKLVAIPEVEYRRYLAFTRSRNPELAEVLQAEDEMHAGKGIRAASVREALKEARARSWID